MDRRHTEPSEWDEEGEPAQAEQARLNRVRQLQAQLDIAFEEAEEIEKIAANKGLQGKIKVDQIDEEMHMSEDIGRQVLSNDQMLKALSDLETKIYFPKHGAKTSDGKEQKVLLARDLKSKDKQKTGDIFTLKYLNTPAGKYMQGRITDEAFERDVVSSLRKFYEQRRFFGSR